MIPLRFIGDVHGRIPEYVRLCHAAENTVQVGDLGFRRHYDEVTATLDPVRHRFLPGNHDDYEHLPPHSLGDFGVHEAAGISMFFVRGAFSIDQKYRVPKLNWWPEEELPEERLREAIRLYAEVKPGLMVTHDCPMSICPRVGNAQILREFGFRGELCTRTQAALQEMLDLHQPRRWIFGHYHRDRTFEVNGVTFTCLAELGVLDMDSPEFAS